MIVAYIDGGARGNPGPAGYGVRIEQQDGSLLEEFSESIGTATNNVAEYRALIAALERAKDRGEREVRVRSDSLLLVQQMRGVFKVKNVGLQPLHAVARRLAHEIGTVTFEHVGRALNAHADRLANAAMDGAGSVVSRQSSVVSHKSSVVTPQSSVQNGPFSALERAVRLFVYKHFVETARSPSVEEIAGGVRSRSALVAAALKRLADMRALVLAPGTTTIWMAHPFSAIPTEYPVIASGRTYWANCAWDAAGILSLLGGEGAVTTRCADCGAELTATARGGRLEGEAVVHYAVPPRRFWENVAYT